MTCEVISECEIFDFWMLCNLTKRGWTFIISWKFTDMADTSIGNVSNLAFAFSKTCCGYRGQIIVLLLEQTDN